MIYDDRKNSASNIEKKLSAFLIAFFFVLYPNGREQERERKKR